MKHVDVEAAVSAAVPVEKKKMTREQKLLHWAGLVRGYGSPLALWHLLEHYQASHLATIPVSYPGFNAFSLVVRDEAFRADGLKADADIDRTPIGTVMGYLELTVDEAHAFSCNCGGSIDSKMIADRIETLAGKPASGPISRVVNGITRAWR
jgi:hypothetical protein